MNLMKIVGTTSIEKYDKIKDSIRSLKVDDYPEQSVAELCKDYAKAFKSLHKARQYDNNLTLVMLRSILKAGNEDFRADLRVLRSTLDAKLMSI